MTRPFGNRYMLGDGRRPHLLEALEPRELLSVTALQTEPWSSSTAGGFDFGPIGLSVAQFDNTLNRLLGTDIAWSLTRSASVSGFIQNASNSTGVVTLKFYGTVCLSIPGATAGNPPGATDNPQRVELPVVYTVPYEAYQTVPISEDWTASLSKALHLDEAQAIANGYAGTGGWFIIYGQAHNSSELIGPTTGGASITWTAQGGAALQVTYSYVTPGSISGTAFRDTNGNGVKDAEDSGLLGRIVHIVGTTAEVQDGAGHVLLPAGIAGGFSDSIPTDANGQFSFTGLMPGTYVLSQTLEDGWTPTSGGPHTITIGPDGTATLGRNAGNDFGVVPNYAPTIYEVGRSEAVLKGGRAVELFALARDPDVGDAVSAVRFYLDRDRDGQPDPLELVVTTRDHVGETWYASWRPQGADHGLVNARKARLVPLVVVAYDGYGVASEPVYLGLAPRLK